MDAVRITGVTKTFRNVTAVDNLSLTVPEGSIYGFIGPNGSGKTTTMRMIVRIYYPDRGDIQVFGDQHPEACSDRIGYLPEERGLYQKMSVLELLKFHGELRSGRNAEAEVRSWLERLDMERWASHKIESLSRGMSQKIQFIASVIPEPELLLLDEPFSGLDPVSADTLRSAILDLRRRGATIILSTHDMHVAETMCDYICMIFQGRKVLDGTLSSIQSKYGEEVIRVSIDGNPDSLRDLPGVLAVRDLGQVQELRLGRGSDPQEALRALLARVPVNSFSLGKPSLHDIFIRIAGPAAEEARVAGA